MTKKIETQPYRGVRDFYPEDMFVRNYLFEIMRLVVESFGYQEYDASILEPLELYKAKSGEEIVNEQTYNFEDRGGRQVSLRPEMTPTLARMVSARRQDLPLPIRWYSIPNVFRYEKPQKGRLREHWQLNADILGVKSIDAEAEIIQLARELLLSFGATDKDFIIKINNRKILDSLYERYNLSSENAYKLSKVLDKKTKIDESAFEEAVGFILGGKTEEFLELVRSTPTLIDKLSKENEGVRELTELIDKLENLGLQNIEFDPTLTRGLDYYTGIVFEIFDSNPENRRAMFGGGRYSNLLDVFGAEPLEAVGFGMGDVVLTDFLMERNLIPESVSSVDMILCRVENSKEVSEKTEKIAGKLREDGLNVSIDLTQRKVGDQIKTADKSGVPFIACIGPDEVAGDEITLKQLSTGEETKLKTDQVAQHITNTLSEGADPQ